jgi:hypothetical protein
VTPRVNRFVHAAVASAVAVAGMAAMAEVIDLEHEAHSGQPPPVAAQSEHTPHTGQPSQAAASHSGHGHQPVSGNVPVQIVAHYQPTTPRPHPEPSPARTAPAPGPLHSGAPTSTPPTHPSTPTRTPKPSSTPVADVSPVCLSVLIVNACLGGDQIGVTP